MPEAFFSLSRDDQREALLVAASRSGRAVHLLEKEPIEPPAHESAPVGTGTPGSPDLGALDASVGTRLAGDRPAFSPRNLPTP